MEKKIFYINNQLAEMFGLAALLGNLVLLIRRLAKRCMHVHQGVF